MVVERQKKAETVPEFWIYFNLYIFPSQSNSDRVSHSSSSTSIFINPYISSPPPPHPTTRSTRPGSVPMTSNQDPGQLAHEINLLTFLNKGILQSNAEQKLRIAELEQENKVLNNVETRLAEKEDQLEAAQDKMRSDREKVRSKMKEYEGLLYQERAERAKEREGREKAEKELQSLRRQLARMEEKNQLVREGLLSGMGELIDKVERESLARLAQQEKMSMVSLLL